MKLHPEDPRLTAYVLGELAPDEAAAVEQAAAADPALEAAIREMRDIRQFLTDRLVSGEERLLPSQTANIRRSAKAADRAEKLAPFTRACEIAKAWLIPASAAAVLTVATLIFIHMSRKPGEEIATQTTPPPRPPEITEPAAVVPAPAVSGGYVAASIYPTLQLPVGIGNENLAAVTTTIREEGKLPDPATVRPEEILNAFPLRFRGVASIARNPANVWHPDARDGGVPPPVATLTTEMIACPWKPSANLLFISLRGNDHAPAKIALSYQANSVTVSRYRLIGNSSGSAVVPVDGAVEIGKDEVVTLAIEIEPATPGREFGSLVWSVDGQAAPPVILARKADAEPSDDARFAALVSTFGQWIAKEQVGLIDAEIVAGLAREIAATELPPERARFLELIDKSLRL